MTIQELSKKARLLEKELIGKIISSENLIPQTIGLITEDDFHVYGDIYTLIVTANQNGKNIATEFQVHNKKISEFLDDVSFRPIKNITQEIKETKNSIRLYGILENSLKSIPDENIDKYVSDIQKQIVTTVKDTTKEKSDISSIIQEYTNRQEFYKEKYKNGDSIIGIPTGYKKLDDVIDGLRQEHLWVIGGYTNSGKTAASLNIVANLIKQGKRVVYYSLEMSNVDILSRLIGIMAEESGLSIIKGFASDKEKINGIIKQIQDSNLSIHTTKSNLSEIQYSMYEEDIKQKADVYVIDFLQLVTVKGAKTEYETITESSLEFQQMAKRLKTTIILLSQISNEGARNQNDIVMSFKGSGSIAAAADLAIEIQIGEESKETWKEKMNNGETVCMKWVIRKNRHGKIGYIEMDFSGRTGVFSESTFERF